MYFLQRISAKFYILFSTKPHTKGCITQEYDGRKELEWIICTRKNVSTNKKSNRDLFIQIFTGYPVPDLQIVASFNYHPILLSYPAIFCVSCKH